MHTKKIVLTCGNGLDWLFPKRHKSIMKSFEDSNVFAGVFELFDQFNGYFGPAQNMIWKISGK